MYGWRRPLKKICADYGTDITGYKKEAEVTCVYKKEQENYCEKSKLSQNRGIDTKNRLTQ